MGPETLKEVEGLTSRANFVRGYQGDFPKQLRYKINFKETYSLNTYVYNGAL